MKIAIFQADTIDNEIEKNLNKYNIFINQLEEDTDLLVFPEMFNTGFLINTNYAERMNGNSLKWLMEKAKANNIAISTTILIEEEGKYFNRHFFVFPDGKYEYYDKKHLFCLSKEPDIITKGRDKKIINYKGWNIALFTCYDVRFPSWCRNTYSDGKYGYDIAIYSASWASGRNHAWVSLPIARAIENVSYVIAVNRVGIDEDGISYWGYSRAINYKGEELLSTHHNEEEIRYCVLDKERLDSFRKSFPVGRDWD